MNAARCQYEGVCHDLANTGWNLDAIVYVGVALIIIGVVLWAIGNRLER